eukprot:612622-Hanusia_phi.AAC.3
MAAVPGAEGRGLNNKGSAAAPVDSPGLQHGGCLFYSWPGTCFTVGLVALGWSVYSTSGWWVGGGSEAG